MEKLELYLIIIVLKNIFIVLKEVQAAKTKKLYTIFLKISEIQLEICKISLGKS